MRYCYSLVVLFLNWSFIFSQSLVKFEIEEISLSDSLNFKTTSDFIKLDTVFFQDDDYSVRTTCYGEFGGSIWFKNKKSEIEYSCYVTCPVSINKIDKKYLITTSLCHFQCGSEIFEITSPDSMDIFQIPDSKPVINKFGWHKRRWYKGGFRKLYYANSFSDFVSKSERGTNLIMDTLGVNILLSFPYKQNLYNIVSDGEKLYLSSLEDRKLNTIDTIFDGLQNFYKYENENGIKLRISYSTISFETKDNHYVVLFENSGLLGYLDIYENKITITQYK